MRRVLMALTISILLPVGPALAGIGKHNGEIGFDFGSGRFDRNLTDSTGARFTIRGGYHFTDWFQIEGENVGMATSGPLGGVDSDVTIGASFVNGVFNLFHSKNGVVVPYVLGGVGLATVRIHFDGFGNDDDTGGASQLAIGSRFFFGRHKGAAVRVEADLMRHRTTGFAIADQRYREKSFTAGFTWRLGARR